MLTTCATCSQTDALDLAYWVRDSEGFWHHRDCQRQDLEDRLRHLRTPRDHAPAPHDAHLDQS